MKVVARRTGLSPHLIRIWERRYNAVSPSRSGTNRRLYSDREIARLALLQRATRAGHSIGHICKLTEEELRELLRQDGDVGLPSLIPVSPKPQGSTNHFVPDSLTAIRNLNAQELERVLSRATADLGQLGLLQQVMVPLVHQIGELWQEGSLKVAHEHVATSVIRTFLGTFTRAYALPECAPRLLVTTPAGQLHELGALMVAVAASNHGWRVTYLGPCLPAEEIAGAALQNEAQAVALSLVYPEADPYLEGELTRLRQLLPETAIFAGGRAVASYAAALDRIGAHQLASLTDLQARLDETRSPHR